MGRRNKRSPGKASDLSTLLTPGPPATILSTIGRARIPIDAEVGEEATCILRLLGARDLIHSDYGQDKSIPPQRTSFVKVSHPCWDENFQFPIDNEDLASKQLEVCLWLRKRSKNTSNEWLWKGQILINIVKLTALQAFNRDIERDFHFLSPRKDGSSFEDTGVSLNISLRLQGERAEIVPISRVHFSGISPGYEGEDDEIRAD
eukprot:754650-Hanusia_phi.AAC.1